MISLIAINGGTGVYEFPGLEAAECITIDTPFGTHSSDTRAHSAAVAHRRAARPPLSRAYIQSLKEAGVFVTTDWLCSGATATVLSVRDGVLQIQDDPYAAGFQYAWHT